MSLETDIEILQDHIETLLGITTSGGFLGHTVTPQTGSQFIVRPICAYTDTQTRRPGTDLKVAVMLVAASPAALIQDLSQKVDLIRRAFNGADQTLCICTPQGKCSMFTLASDLQFGEIEGFQESRVSSAVTFCKMLMAFKLCVLSPAAH